MRDPFYRIAWLDQAQLLMHHVCILMCGRSSPPRDDMESFLRGEVLVSVSPSCHLDETSATAAIMVAMVSLVTGCAVRGDVAISATVDARGHVWGVGSPDDKVRGARRAGAQHMVLAIDDVAKVERALRSVRRREKVPMTGVRCIMEALDFMLVKPEGQIPTPHTQHLGYAGHAHPLDGSALQVHDTARAVLVLLPSGEVPILSTVLPLPWHAAGLCGHAGGLGLPEEDEDEEVEQAQQPRAQKRTLLQVITAEGTVSRLCSKRCGQYSRVINKADL